MAHRPTIAEINMKLYDHRLKSFYYWRFPTSKHQLAAAGFYYIGPDIDRVKCAFCQIELKLPEHDPVIEHKKRSTNCSYLNQPEQETVKESNLSDENKLLINKLNPKHSEYCYFDKRLESYDECDLTDFNKKQIASAGFYHTGDENTTHT